MPLAFIAAACATTITISDFERLQVCLRNICESSPGSYAGSRVKSKVSVQFSFWVYPPPNNGSGTEPLVEV